MALLYFRAVLNEAEIDPAATDCKALAYLDTSRFSVDRVTAASGLLATEF